ncbi:hypothetical protein C8R44DRAFT_974769 [Mycena epipterygia]|nr:hypothetical protein C8R44DRAFT_974769 [Mycena epipterygia]
MSSATAALNLDGLQLAHDTAAQIMSQLSTESSIPEEDRRALQVFYSDLEQRQAALGQDVNFKDETETVEADIKAKAVGFATFLASLDPSDAATRLLVQGSDCTTTALANIERGGNFLESAPMAEILDAYERIQCREEDLKAAGGPVSMVNAVIYLSEATAFADAVEMLIVLDLRVPPADLPSGRVGTTV